MAELRVLSPLRIEALPSAARSQVVGMGRPRGRAARASRAAGIAMRGRAGRRGRRPRPGAAAGRPRRPDRAAESGGDRIAALPSADLLAAELAPRRAAVHMRTRSCRPRVVRRAEPAALALGGAVAADMESAWFAATLRGRPRSPSCGGRRSTTAPWVRGGVGGAALALRRVRGPLEAWAARVRPRRRRCSPHRARSAPASSGRSRSSSGPSTASGPRSTSAARSCTTRHVVADLEAQGRGLRPGARRGPRRRHGRACRPRGLARVRARPRRAPDLARGRRDLSARRQGAPRGAPVRRPGPPHRARRPQRPRRGRSAPSARSPTGSTWWRRRRRRRARLDVAGRPRRVSHPDHPRGRRDRRGGRRAARAVRRVSPERPTTSATPRQNRQDAVRAFAASAISCSSSARRTPRTPRASSRWPAARACRAELVEDASPARARPGSPGRRRRGHRRRLGARVTGPRAGLHARCASARSRSPSTGPPRKPSASPSPRQVR